MMKIYLAALVGAFTLIAVCAVGASAQVILPPPPPATGGMPPPPSPPPPVITVPQVPKMDAPVRQPSVSPPPRRKSSFSDRVERCADHAATLNLNVAERDAYTRSCATR